MEDFILKYNGQMYLITMVLAMNGDFLHYRMLSKYGFYYFFDTVEDAKNNLTMYSQDFQYLNKKQNYVSR